MVEEFLVAFDLERMQPACPLVAAGLGANTGVSNLFPLECASTQPRLSS